MSDDKPLEPDADLLPDRSPVPPWSGRAPVTTSPRRPVRRRHPGPAAHRLDSGSRAAGIRAAGLAYRIASRTPSVAADTPGAEEVVPGRLEISWTRIEIRRCG